MHWIFIIVVYVQVSVLQGICPSQCICEAESSVCDECEQWYIAPSSNCNTPITVSGWNFEYYSKPVIKFRTVTTLIVTFIQYATSGIEQYFYYVLQRKSQDFDYTDITSLMPHLSSFGEHTAREFLIEGLQKNTSYQFRTVIYRRLNGIQQQLAVTSPTTGTTFCSVLLKPSGVFASSGQLSFTVHWEDLFYDPSCGHAVVDVFFTNVDNVFDVGESRIIPDDDVANNPGSYTVTNVQASSYNVNIIVNFSNTNFLVYSDTVPVNVTVDPVATQTKSPATSTMTLCNTTTTSYRLYTDNNPTALPPNNNNPTILPTNDHNPTPQTPTSTQRQQENTGQVSCSCTTLSTNDNNPTALPTNNNNPTILPTNDHNPTPQTPTSTHGHNENTGQLCCSCTTSSTDDDNPTALPTIEKNSPSTLPIIENSPTPTNGNNPSTLPTNDNNPTSLSINKNNPTHQITTHNNLTPLPTSNYGPTHQTPSSTLMQEGSTDRQLNRSFVCDNSLVTVPVAILSVIVLLLVILLIVSFCYIVSLRRRLKGMKTYRMGDLSDMHMTQAVTPAPRAEHGRNQNRAVGHPTPYYNTVTSAAVMPGTDGSMRGEAGGLYEEVAGSREPVRPAVYLGLGQHNNN